MSINRVIVSGNLTREPELRMTQTGMQVLSLGMAVNDRRKNQQTGDWEDVPNFVDVKVFGNRAESLSHILAKGSKVCVEGKLRYSSWERDGQKRSKLEVVADEVELMPKGGQQQPQAAPQAYAPAPQPYAAPAPAYAPQTPMAPAPQPYAASQAPAMQPLPMAQPAQIVQPPASVYDDDIPF